MNSLKEAVEALENCGLSAQVIFNYDSMDASKQKLFGGIGHIQTHYYKNPFSIVENDGFWVLRHHELEFSLYFSDLSQCVDTICQMCKGQSRLVQDFSLSDELHNKFSTANLHYQVLPLVDSSAMILGGKLHLDLDNLVKAILQNPLGASEQELEKAENDLSQTFRITCIGSMFIGQLNQFSTQNRGIVHCSPRLSPVIDIICDYYETGEKPSYDKMVTF